MLAVVVEDNGPEVLRQPEVLVVEVQVVLHQVVQVLVLLVLLVAAAVVVPVVETVMAVTVVQVS